MTPQLDPETTQAIAHRLGINVPIYRAYREGHKLTLLLYGGLRITAALDAADLTAIPTIGPVTAAALAAAGYTTFEDLRSAPDYTLLDIPSVNQRNIDAIRAYLQEQNR